MIDISDNEFKKISEYVKSNYGVNLKSEKKSLVLGRLQNVLMQKNFESFTAYIDYVISDRSGDAGVTLINKLTTNHTFFMRETEHFNYFRDHVLPYLESLQKNQKDLRIWSAGCSSGEEPYTLAMILADYFGSSKAMWDTRILATDISTKVLETATKCVYSNEQMEALPHSWKANYFKSIDTDNNCVVDKIKNEIIFRRFNLMNESFPFKKKFHVIFCRNVMIYFDNDTKHDLIQRFYESTEPGGYLFIGHSESITRDDSRYKYKNPAVYRKE